MDKYYVVKVCDSTKSKVFTNESEAKEYMEFLDTQTPRPDIKDYVYSICPDMETLAYQYPHLYKDYVTTIQR